MHTGLQHYAGALYFLPKSRRNAHSVPGVGAVSDPTEALLLPCYTSFFVYKRILQFIWADGLSCRRPAEIFRGGVTGTVAPPT